MDSVSDQSAAADLRATRRQRSSGARNGLDRLPPHSPEAEQGVLGCALLSPNECIGECIEKLKDGGQEVFYDLRHQTIYETLAEMFNSREPVDIITVQQKLKNKQLLDQIGGIAYLSQLQDAVPSAANLSYYLDIVREKYLLRKMISVCTDVVGRVYDYEGEVDALCDEVERDILAIGKSRVSNTETGVKELVHESINRIEKLWQRKGAISGISTGIHDLDKKTDGLHGGDLIVVAAYPSVGKTSLLMNIVENVVLDQKLPVGIFTYEMSGVSLVTRFICSHARINLRNIRDGIICETDFPKITHSAGRISNAPIYFEHNGDLNLMQLRAKARRWKQQYGIKLIGVDYIQKVKPSGSNKGDNREREVSAISDGLKSLAMELDLPVIALSQLNDDGKLRESRTIGQDADGVWMLERDDEKSTEEADFVDLWLRKQRNEERDVCVNLTFLKKITRFEQRENRIIADEDVPNHA
jgi:replicative DNA helicase